MARIYSAAAFGRLIFTKEILSASSRYKTMASLSLQLHHDNRYHNLLPYNSKKMSTESNKPLANYQQVKRATSDPNILIIDVREPSELQETGAIPGSINIPLGEVESVLKVMSDDEFQEKFDKNKPKESTPIIFSCKLGKRSESAQDIAVKLGFKNVENYLGGWLEWEEKIKEKSS